MTDPIERVIKEQMMAKAKVKAAPKKRSVVKQPAVVAGGTAGTLGPLVTLLPPQYQWIGAIASVALSIGLPAWAASRQQQRAGD